MSEDALPESDRIEGAPHPRETENLFGQEAAEKVVIEALNNGRMHHAWLLTGPKGVGKATLGWRMARALLTTPAPNSGLFGGAPATLTSLDVNRMTLSRAACQHSPSHDFYIFAVHGIQIAKSCAPRLWSMIFAA